ncbi:MAG: GIY-YIG nuclease family protein [Chloroflexi bacterium]|nr:GIY-YIG nuclease family protein [Chloroflexota bacterium]
MIRTRHPAVYIMASEPRGTLYIGTTSNLPARVWQHKTEATDGFTAKYGVKSLVWYETHDDMTAAISREKALKNWQRVWKFRLIEEMNPEWQDLYQSIL